MVRYFRTEDLVCPECNGGGLDNDFLQKLIDLREECGFQFEIVRAYQCDEHNSEGPQEALEAFNKGLGVSIKVSGKRAYKLLREAMMAGFVGIGISDDEVTIDMHYEGDRPKVWKY